MTGRWWGVITEAAVPELAEAILDPGRRQPIIVVTTRQYVDPSQVPQSSLDEAAALRDAIGDIADIAIVATGTVSFALEALLPPGWHTFNGACRSYPAGILADPDIRRSPLRWRQKGEPASEQVISDALGHAHAAGLFDGKQTTSVSTEGTIKGFVADGERALIDVGAVMPAVIWREMTSPGIPLDWVIAKGATVPGEHDRSHNRFLLRRVPFGTEEVLAAFPHGVVTLALVDQVDSEYAVLRVHPDVAIRIHRSDVSSNPLDVLDLFLVEGEVVRARVVHLSTGQPHLRLSDVDDDEPVVPPVAIVEGGTPWLVEGRALPSPAAEPPVDVPDAPTELVDGPPQEGRDTASGAILPEHIEDATAPADTPPPAPAPPPRPVPGPGLRPVTSETPVQHAPSLASPDHPAGGGSKLIKSMQDTIAALRAEVERLKRENRQAQDLRHELDVMRRELRDARAELGRVLNENHDQKALHKKAVEELRKARRSTTAAPQQRTPFDRREDWPDDESWVRHEILLAWSARVPRVDKARLPLPDDYIVGPDFAASLLALDEGQFDKAMKCTVDVLIGTAKDIAGRELHRLRSGESGGEAPRTRASDGAIAWRAAIEIHAASARRLHYWAIGQRIELARVSVHDDMEL